MMYAILIYGSEERVRAWSEQEMAEVMGRHAALRAQLTAQGRMGPVLRLEPPAPPLITDGPFAETKEQLMGIYVLDCATFAEAEEAARRLDFDGAAFEVRPVGDFHPGQLPSNMSPL